MIRLLVAYDGTDLSGFASQPGQRTVQGVLEDALSGLAREPVRLVGAGRTDAGVHALGQVVSLPRPGSLAAEDVLRAMAGRTPRDVGVVDAADAEDGFDARRSALWRAYTYLIWNGDAPHPLFARFATWTTRSFDTSKLRDALQVVVGTHDFRSFARVREDQSPIRTVLEAGCSRDGSMIRIRIVARSYLHQMVRSIVGSALEVAAGRKPVAWMAEALLASDRASAGPVAPARGLTLVDVGYEDAPWHRRGPVPWPWSNDDAAHLGTRTEVCG